MSRARNAAMTTGRPRYVQSSQHFNGLLIIMS